MKMKDMEKNDVVSLVMHKNIITVCTYVRADVLSTSKCVTVDDWLYSST
jgi:hypothetical protein